MVKMIQRKGASDAIVVSSLVVFYRGSGRPETAPALERTQGSDSTLYQGLRSKEDLVRAFLEGRNAVWVRWFQNEINTRCETNAACGLGIIADALREWFESPQLRCSALIDAILSNCDFDGESLQIGRPPKDQLRRSVEMLAARMGLHCPELAASAAVLIIERTIAMILATGDLSELDTAQLLFECLQHALSTEFN